MVIPAIRAERKGGIIMKMDTGSFNPGRREFIARVVPACALACFSAGDMFAMPAAGEEKPIQQDLHTFDKEFDGKLTYRQYMDGRYKEFIWLAKALDGEWGEERTIEFLKRITAEKMTAYGRKQAISLADNSFESYVRQFRLGYGNTLKMNIVEDTPAAFELEVTECIWADTFLRAGAAKIGYASVCWGDYAWAESFNEKITMVRDKTLMQGHECCNHRYLWKG